MATRKKRFVALRTSLRKKAKGRGRGLTDPFMESLEDRYSVDLTSNYGEEKSLSNVDRIIKKISKYGSNRPRRIKAYKKYYYTRKK